MTKTKIVSLIFASVLLSLTLVAVLLYRGTVTPKMGQDFTLNFRGQPWNFKEHAKNLNLIYVGYVKCPDVCPLSLSFASQAFKKLSSADLKNVQLIFISVDTEHDTAAGVSDYASQFFSEFIGLTGQADQIKKSTESIGASFMVEKDPKSYLGYSIAHSDRIFFLNRKAEVIDTLANPRSEQMITQKIKENL